MLKGHSSGLEPLADAPQLGLLIERAKNKLEWRYIVGMETGDCRQLIVTQFMHW